MKVDINKVVKIAMIYTLDKPEDMLSQDLMNIPEAGKT